MRRERRRPRTAGARPESRDRRPRRSPTSSPTPATTAAKSPANRGSPPAPLAAEEFLQRVVPGDRSLARLQRRRPDRDHLRAGAPDRAHPRRQLLLHRPGLPEPARRTRRRSRHRPGQTERRRRPRRPAAALALRRPRHASTKAATTTTTRCCCSIEELFELEPLGYAAENALTAASTAASTTRKHVSADSGSRAAAPAAATAPAGRRRPTRARRLPRRTRGGRCSI